MRGSRRRWRWRRSERTGRSPSWRVSSACIRTRSTTGRSSCWTAQRAFSRAAVQRRGGPATRRRSMFCTGRSASCRSKTIFWHESSANEPGATARDGRAREPGAAGIPAMPVAGGVALGSLPEAGRGERRRSCNDGADRSAVSGSAVLWLAADGGVVGDAGPCRQSQTGPMPDAAAGTGGDLSTPEHEQTGSGPQDLPVPPRRDRDRAGQSGMVLGRYLHPDVQRLPLPGGHHGLGEPSGAGVAIVQHARRSFLCRCTRGSARSLRPPRDLQYRPEPALAKAGGSQFTSDDFTGTLKRHGVMISMDGKGRCMDNVFVERLWRSLKYEEVYLNI